LAQYVCSTKMNQQIRLNNIKIFIMYHEHAGSTLPGDAFNNIAYLQIFSHHP
jgi:hypothetical protein